MSAQTSEPVAAVTEPAAAAGTNTCRLLAFFISGYDTFAQFICIVYRLLHSCVVLKSSVALSFMRYS